ncbi:hypothetical protein CBR_g4528 [Chara braunii]|uniref:Integrase catalytic domain-containing protein n=1 Tax=Chara braunii TaxID=69332 RepID=A0A388KI52_CHABU|nr:hypothetical protein CBR_g4528 [Chara braunii]|eukprot:GBG69697.1 hypothetical protein CBR_g4528 [Chara braunii]
MPEEGTWTDLESAYQTVMLAKSDAFLWIETMWTKVTLARITPCLLVLEFRGTVEARGWIYLSKERETAMVVEFALGKLPYKLFREAEWEVVWAACQRVEMTMESIDVRVELGDRENVRKPYRAIRESRMAREQSLWARMFRGWTPRKVEGGAEMVLPTRNEWRGAACDWVGVEMVPTMSFLWVERVWDPVRENEAWDDIAEGNVEALGTVCLSKNGWYIFCTHLAEGRDPMWTLEDAERLTWEMGQDFANEGWDEVGSRVVMGGWEDLRLPYQLVQVRVPHFVAHWFGGYEHISAVAESMDEVELGFTWLSDDYYEASLQFGPFHGDRAEEVVEILKELKDYRLEDTVYLVVELEWRARGEFGGTNLELPRRVQATGSLYLLDAGWQTFGVALADGGDPVRMFDGAWQVTCREGFAFANPDRDDVTATVRVVEVGASILPYENVRMVLPPFSLERMGGVERAEMAVIALGRLSFSNMSIYREYYRAFLELGPFDEEQEYEVLNILQAVVGTRPGIPTVTEEVVWEIARREIGCGLTAIFANNGGTTRPYEPAGHAPATAHGNRRRMGSVTPGELHWLEEAEPIDAFLDYEGGTLVVDSEMAGTTCTTGELLIKALEKGPPTVAAELREGTVTKVGRREEKDATGSVVKPRDVKIALAAERGWRRVMSMMESQELEMQHYQAYQVDNNQTGTQEEEQFFLIKSYEGFFREIGLLQVGKKEPHEVSPRARKDADRSVLRRGHLFRKEEGLTPRRVVCGRIRQLDIIQAMHDGLAGGHRSSKGTLAKITPLYYWSGMASMVATYRQTCKISQERSTVHIFEPLRPTRVLGPGHMVHLDLAVMSVSRKGYRYILDARKNLSGFVEATTLKKKTGFAVADWVENFYLRHPFIRRFIGDNGTEFVNQDVLNTCKRLGVLIKLTEPYHPEVNAPLERGHQTLKNTIAKLAADDLGNWPDYLRHAVFAENMTPKRTTGCIPAKLWYGREIDFSVEALVPTRNKLEDDPHLTTEQLIEARCEQAARNEEALEGIAHKVLDSRMKDKTRWDQLKNIRKEPLQVGEMVLVRNSALETTWSGQLGRQFKGPCRIARKLGVSTFEIENLDGITIRGPVPAQRPIRFLTRDPVEQWLQEAQDKEAGSGQRQETYLSLVLLVVVFSFLCFSPFDGMGVHESHGKTFDSAGVFGIIVFVGYWDEQRGMGHCTIRHGIGGALGKGGEVVGCSSFLFFFMPFCFRGSNRDWGTRVGRAWDECHKGMGWGFLLSCVRRTKMAPNNENDINQANINVDDPWRQPETPQNRNTPVLVIGPQPRPLVRTGKRKMRACRPSPTKEGDVLPAWPEDESAQEWEERREEKGTEDQHKEKPGQGSRKDAKGSTEDDSETVEDIPDIVIVSSDDEMDRVSRPRPEGQASTSRASEEVHDWEEVFCPTPSHWFEVWASTFRHHWIIIARSLMAAGETVTPTDFFLEKTLHDMKKTLDEVSGLDDLAMKGLCDMGPFSCRVETRTGMGTTPYMAEQEAKVAAILKERKEKKEAKKKALQEEQATKLKKIEEEMAREKERLKREEEAKLKEVEEEEEEVEEEPLERGRRGNRGASSETKEDLMEKKISEWGAGLTLGEDEEALMYVPRDEQEVVVREWEAEGDPLKRQVLEDEKRMEWKFRLTGERKTRMEAATEAAQELEEIRKQRDQMAVQVDLLGKVEILAKNVERLAKAQEEQLLFGRGQDIVVRSIRSGLRDFARELAMQLGSYVTARLEGTKRYCVGAKLTAPKRLVGLRKKQEPAADRGSNCLYHRAIKTLEEHQGHLTQVLVKLREANFKINAKKCEWAKTQVLYLGHVLDEDSIKPEDSKIAAIRDWPIPRTLTELWSFLGLANYYRKFVRNFSTIAAPLRKLLRKETIWKWDKDCTSAMKKLKQTLIEYPVLKVADPSLPFVVTTDASQFGIGVVPQQDDGNGNRPVEFMSARMTSEKVATSTYERELYALWQALDHWKHYLLGRHFKVYSDHETLRWLKTQAKMTPKLTRWAAEIDQYDFELKPVKGKYNVVADALSRRADYFGAIVHYLDIGRDLQERVKEAYAQDPIYSDLLKKVKEAPKTEPDYRTTDGLLFEKTNVVDRLCIPNSEEIRSLILGECHDTEGHFGWQKTLANLMRAYTWPRMKNDCIEYVRSCKVCQSNKTTTHAPLGLLRPLPIPDQPGDSVSIDFMDASVKSRHGKSQVMVIVDRFSKYAVFIPLPSEARTELVIRKFFYHWVSEHGVPLSIVSDRDTRFTSQNWQVVDVVKSSPRDQRSDRTKE